MKLIHRTASIVFLIWSFLIFISSMILVLPFIVISSVLFNGKKAADAIFFFLRIWGWIFCILCFFEIRIQKDSLFTPSKTYIYICNHSSYLDGIAIVIAIQESFKPLGKVEMAKIPLFGIIYRRVVVMIERENKESREKGFKDLKDGLLKGQSILIFPEGTMNRSDKTLAEFYDGAFRLAIETQTPIAPMVILNAGNLFPRANPLNARPGTITCIFDEPVEVSGLVSEDLKDLKAQVFKRMKSLIERQI